MLPGSVGPYALHRSPKTGIFTREYNGFVVFGTSHKQDRSVPVWLECLKWDGNDHVLNLRRKLECIVNNVYLQIYHTT